jgi:chromosome segregation ATPase
MAPGVKRKQKRRRMPTKTKDIALQIEDAKAEHSATQVRINELTNELSEIPGRISNVDWSDEQKAIAEVAELERRRDGLPHYLRHLRKQAAEQEIAFLKLEMEEAESRRPELQQRVEETQQAFNAAQEQMSQAKGALHDLIYVELSDLRRSITDAEKMLWTVTNDKGPEASGPVVRSTWQQTQQQPGAEDLRAAG